jgi:hypothetical protein
LVEDEAWLDPEFDPEFDPGFEVMPVAAEFEPTDVAAFGLAALTSVAYVKPVVAELAPGTER